MLHTLPFCNLRHLCVIEPSVAFDSGIREITVHSFYFCKIGTSTLRTYIHIQLFVTAVITIRQRQIDALIVPFCHSTSHKRFDRIHIVTDRIFYILDFSAVAQVPETSFQVLFFNRCDLFCYMTVKTVADIFSVRYIFNDSILLRNCCT